MKAKIYIFSLIIFVLLGGLSCRWNKENKGYGDKKTELETNKKIVQVVIHSTATGISEVLKTLPDSASGVRFIRTYIDSVRFFDDKSGYFYVYNYQGINIAHAMLKDIQGKNLYNHLDSRGNYVLRDLSEACKHGGGFVKFYWKKPGTTGEKLKIGYVEPILGTNYFIGSGVYIPE